MTSLRQAAVFALLAFAALSAGCAPIALRADPQGGCAAEAVAEISRPASPDGLSGICRDGDGRYLAIDDTGGVLYLLELRFGARSRRLLSCSVAGKVALEGVVDGEDVAFDPLRGTVWACDEDAPSIAEFDRTTGRRLREVALPPHFSRMRRYYGVESLCISPDGLSMWSSTEEAVDGDGPLSSCTNGTMVRLQQFVRDGAGGEWRAARQCPYLTDPIGGTFVRMSRSGVVGLLARGDGTLLVLERELGAKTFVPTFRTRLYAVDPRNAADVSGTERLSGAAVRPVEKRLVFGANTHFAMYEGIAVGPVLPDGRETVVLVSDGDGAATESMMHIALPR